jgi:hypothetical protein
LKSLYKSFYDVLKYSNYKVLKCYKLAFSWNNFYKNIGTILVSVYFVIYLTFLLIYVLKEKDELRIDLVKIMYNSNPKEINAFYITANGFIEKSLPVTKDELYALNPYHGLIYEKIEFYSFHLKRYCRKVFSKASKFLS